MKTIKITVTQEDIDAGERYKGESCPIAHAMKRTFATDCNVQRSCAYVGYESHRAFLGPVARDFIWHFDMGHPVEPFEFHIDDGSPDFVRDHLT